MAVLAENGRNKLWFGTLDWMEFLPTPNRGADVSPTGWNAGGQLLSGGAYQFGSFNSAKGYQFEWPESSSRTAAQLMKSYADGTYGRGLIYFVDPLIYNTNMLPAMWADPSMAVASESNTLVPGVTPTATPTTGNSDLRLPVQSAFYNLANVGTTGPETLDDSNSVFIPIPEGYFLFMGAFYSATGSAGVFYSPVFQGGTVSGSNSVVALPTSGTNAFNTFITATPGQVGVRIWVGKTTSGAATITLSAMHIRAFPQGSDLGSLNTGEPFWVGGQGHSGCRFTGYPTYVNNTGVNGGQVGYAASFVEVGSWVMG